MKSRLRKVASAAFRPEPIPDTGDHPHPKAPAQEAKAAPESVRAGALTASEPPAPFTDLSVPI